MLSDGAFILNHSGFFIRMGRTSTRIQTETQMHDNKALLISDNVSGRDGSVSHK